MTIEIFLLYSKYINLHFNLLFRLWESFKKKIRSKLGHKRR